MTRLSIVIVSWNTSALLARCLQSIRQEIERWSVGTLKAPALETPALETPALETPEVETSAVEVLVVDNASHDGSAEMVQRCFPWARLLQSGANLGFAAGNNLAFRACSGEYVWLLNPDTELMPGALPPLVDFLAAHPEAAAVGSLLLNSDGTLQVSCFPEPTLRREVWRLFHLDRLRPYAEYPVRQWGEERAQPVDIVQGASLMVRRSVLEQVGGFDADYFMYTEEVDLCHRIRRAGGQIYWVPQSKVVHFGGQSTQQVAAAMFLHLYRSKILYFQKQKGWWAAQAYKTILALASLARLSLVPFVVLRGAARDARRMALAGNYLRLLLNLHRM
jgi:GT2 family glycosyltransferase